jgi:hypothetical protein
MSSSPHPQRVPLHESLFGLFGGPLAWYVQLNAGFALASQPCFRDGIHLARPIPPLQWTMPAMVLTTLGAFVVALLAPNRRRPQRPGLRSKRAPVACAS